MDVPIDARAAREFAVAVASQGGAQQRRDEDGDRDVKRESEEDLVDMEGEGREVESVGVGADEVDEALGRCEGEGIFHVGVGERWVE